MIVAVAIFTAFLITFILIPVAIKVSHSVDLMDMPDRRKIHRMSISSMGGLAIFIGWVVASGIAIHLYELANLKFVLSGILLIFILGFRDDISSLLARHKLSFQILAATLVVYFGDIKLSGLYGFLGIEELPYHLSPVLSVLVIITLTNAYNLIDGIDGLAGSISILGTTILGLALLELNELPLAMLALTLCGALIAFLFYNWFPSKIFMGDTGSMICGFFISVLSIHFVDTVATSPITLPVLYSSPIALVLSLVILPIYDTMRVIVIRVSHGGSPFVPDRNHIHHMLLKLGFNHGKSTMILISMNLLVVGLTLLLIPYVNQTVLILIQGFLMISFGLVVDQLCKRKKFLGISNQVTSEELFISKSA